MIKTSTKFISLVLVLVSVICLFSFGADALSYSKTNKATGMSILTFNEHIILPQYDTIKVKCTAGSAIKVTFLTISNCTVVGYSKNSSFLVYSGGWTNFKIRTGALKNGKVKIKVESVIGDDISYSVTGSYHCMAKCVV